MYYSCNFYNCIMKWVLSFLYYKWRQTDCHLKVCSLGWSPRLQQYVNCELPEVQVGLKKGRGTRDKLPTSSGSSKKQESSRKTSISASLTRPKPLTVWITISCGKFWKRWEYQTTWPTSWETCMQVRKQQNWTWNNRLVPNRKRNMWTLYIVTLLF